MPTFELFPLALYENALSNNYSSEQPQSEFNCLEVKTNVNIFLAEDRVSILHHISSSPSIMKGLVILCDVSTCFIFYLVITVNLILQPSCFTIQLRYDLVRATRVIEYAKDSFIPSFLSEWLRILGSISPALNLHAF